MIATVLNRGGPESHSFLFRHQRMPASGSFVTSEACWKKTLGTPSFCYIFRATAERCRYSDHPEGACLGHPPGKRQIANREKHPMWNCTIRKIVVQHGLAIGLPSGCLTE
jgi:hypothetical protein